MTRVPRMMVAALILALALPLAGAVSVQDAEDPNGLVFHVPGDGARDYVLQVDARIRLAHATPDGAVAARAFDAGDSVPLRLTAGEHAFRVTHAADAGWLLLVPDDVTEPGAALPFTARSVLALWLSDHARVLTGGALALAACAVAGGAWWTRRRRGA